MPNSEADGDDLKSEAQKLLKKLLDDTNLEIDAILLRPGREWCPNERKRIMFFLERHRSYFEIQARIAGQRETGHDPGEEFGRETWEKFAGDWGQTEDTLDARGEGEDRGA